MTLGDRKGIWADVFLFNGRWHISIFRAGSPDALYISKFEDGYADRSTAIRHGEDFIKSYSRKIIA